MTFGWTPVSGREMNINKHWDQARLSPPKPLDEEMFKYFRDVAETEDGSKATTESPRKSGRDLRGDTMI